MVSTFRTIIDFFGEIGVYDVILPFILVFTIVFAILEKTRVLGSEDIDGNSYPKKNLNAMVAFSISFLVVASSELVEILTEVSSQMIVLLMLSVLFLLLAGSFFKEEKEGFFLKGGWKTTFMALMFVGIMIIFFNAIKYEGESWLQIFWGYVSKSGAGGEAVGSIILLVIIIMFMAFILKENPTPKSLEKKEE